MRADIGRLFRWWSVLRDADTSGRGWFTFAQVQAVFKSLGWSRKQAYDCRGAANGGAVFFSVGSDGRLYLRSLENVCMALETVPGRPVEIPAEALKRQNTFQAEVYAHRFSTETKIARSTLQSEFGISGNTQRRYEHATGVTKKNGGKRHNFIRAGLGVSPLPLPSDTCHVWQTEDGFVWQAPNTYKLNDVHKARRGMSRRVTRNLRRAVELSDDGERQRFMADEAKHEHSGLHARRSGDTFNWWRNTGDEVTGPIYDLVTPIGYNYQAERALVECYATLGFGCA